MPIPRRARNALSGYGQTIIDLEQSFCITPIIVAIENNLELWFYADKGTASPNTYNQISIQVKGMPGKTVRIMWVAMQPTQ